jgi:glycosyltransferase involved in cell wall biosynthesis
MKIVHLTDYFNENVVYQENLLTIGQQELGHQVVVITSNLLIEIPVTKGQRKTKVGSFIFRGVKIIRCPYVFEIKKNSLLYFRKVITNLISEKPDYIFVHDKGLYMFSIIFYKYFINPSVILRMDFHSDYNNSFNSKFGKLYHNFFKFFFKFFGFLFDRYYFIAPEMGQFIHEVYNLPHSKTQLLRLPGDEGETFKFSKEFLRKKWNLKDGHFYIIHSGKLPEGKKTLELINSIKNQDLTLIICGSINDTEEGIKLKKEIENTKNVDYFGWVNPEELRELIKCSDVMVQPGSLSNTFVEAVCIGTPLILANTPQARDLINKKNGLIIDNNSNLEDIQSAINKFLVRQEYYKENASKMKTIFNYKTISKESLKL